MFCYVEKPKREKLKHGNNTEGKEERRRMRLAASLQGKEVKDGDDQK